MGKLSNCKRVCVIDVETNYSDEVISIGAVITDSCSFDVIDKLYLIVYPECTKPAMFSNELEHPKVKIDLKSSRKECIEKLKKFIKKYNVKNIFAYNAYFDCYHLDEFISYNWFDIMKIAAYVQYNPCVSSMGELCSTGRLKTGYNLENILNSLYKQNNLEHYQEIHNALTDAIDEATVMKLLGLKISVYEQAQIFPNIVKRKEVYPSISNEFVRLNVVNYKNEKPEDRLSPLVGFPILKKSYEIEKLLTKTGKKIRSSCTIIFNKTMSINSKIFFCGYLEKDDKKISVYSIIKRTKTSFDIFVYADINNSDLVFEDQVIEKVIPCI